MTAAPAGRALAALARRHGVATSYRDAQGHLRRATPEALRAVLHALGAGSPPRRPAAVEPVIVAWDGSLGALGLRLTPALRGRVRWSVRREDGAEESGCASRDGHGRLRIARRFPLGYHRLTVDAGGEQHRSLLLCAPRRAFGPEDERAWGVLLPLYALRSSQNWGCGEYADLAGLARWTARLGGAYVGTLPLLPAFLDRPFEPSPYAPVSRLFWNEAYLHLDALPEFRPSLRPAAAQLARARAAGLVDWKTLWSWKRRALAGALRTLLARPGARREQFLRFEAEHEDVMDYARFRAAGERQGCGWRAWPRRLAAGRLRAGDFDPQAARTYAYAQWLCGEQIAAAQGTRGARRLYLDLPLGVHGDGYDTWRFRDEFAAGVSGGAPPDPLAPHGQDWSFAPLHPQRMREHGYRYLRACLRHHLAVAGALRVDHALGLHRLFWVPHGMPAARGVYVRYPAAELYAVLCLESQRHRARIVGEDLGTVPPEVRPAMQRHGVARMYVLPFEASGQPRRPLRPVPAGAAACLNTHDLPPFAAFWSAARRTSWGRALADYLRRQGLLEACEAGGGAGADAVLRACLRWLGASPAALVPVSLEDLWLETRPQNVPGTGMEASNWRRKARRSLEQMRRDRKMLAVLRQLRRARESAS
ncbi:MAG: 4-alpha-glucanotransferase [Planctomycetota bacterium]|nr:MAG: 4-alpha-glucanotransferase [Planctomycetota bacterium]